MVRVVFVLVCIVLHQCCSVDGNAEQVHVFSMLWAVPDMEFNDIYR